MGMPPLHPVIDGFKVCSKCSERKGIDCFTKDPRRASGIRSICLDCMRMQSEARRCNPKVYAKDLKRKADKRRGSGQGRVETVKRLHKDGALFCDVMKGRTWSKAYVGPAKGYTINPHGRHVLALNGNNRWKDASAKLRDDGGLFCSVMRQRRWSKAYRPVKGTSDWLRDCSDQEYKDYWVEQGKPWIDRSYSPAKAARERRKFDPAFRAASRIQASISQKTKGSKYRLRIRQSVNRRGKSPTVERDLGYSIDEFMQHFEYLFTDSMCWSAFEAGDIHIDHIRPCASFDLTDMAQIKECYSLSNLQPLWAKDNIRKSSTYKGKVYGKKRGRKALSANPLKT